MHNAQCIAHVFMTLLFTYMDRNAMNTMVEQSALHFPLFSSVDPEENILHCFALFCIAVLGYGTATAQAVVIHLLGHDSPHLWITLTSPITQCNAMQCNAMQCNAM